MAKEASPFQETVPQETSQTKKNEIQWKPLNGITLGHTITDPFNQMMTITKFICIQSMPLRDIWDLFNLGQFDPIN
jgi:hypothetical protein